MVRLITQLVGVRLAGVAANPAPLGTYVLSRGWVLLEAERREFRARVPVVPLKIPIPSLLAESPSFEWKVPMPPRRLIREEIIPVLGAVNSFGSRGQLEAMVNLLWDGYAWKAEIPDQLVTAGSVRSYGGLPEGAVIQIHSHGRMRPFWSATDNADEMGFLVYCVVGGLGTSNAKMLCRVGINGYWHDLEVKDVFSGQ
jgi:hypothetical protein